MSLVHPLTSQPAVDPSTICDDCKGTIYSLPYPMFDRHRFVTHWTVATACDCPTNPCTLGNFPTQEAAEEAMEDLNRAARIKCWGKEELGR
jgi:hypothetical protein